MSLYVPPPRDEVVLELRPWISGFVLKEYGTHVDPNDQVDLVQEGCLSLLQIVAKLEEQAPRFNNKDEYLYYVKQVVRNSIRDYVLRMRSRFEISLYKLRRELRCDCPHAPRWHTAECSKPTLGAYMTGVGDDFAYTQDEESEDPGEWLTRQRRLSLLSAIRKNGRGMSLEDCQVALASVLKEYKKHLMDEDQWNFAPTAPRIAPLVVEQMEAPASPLPHQRTPLASPSLTPERVVKCANHFCEMDLRSVKVPVVYRGFGYCSKTCRKEWPPVVIKLQAQYEAPIAVILEVSLKLFRSKRRTAEILNMASSTMERLVFRFGIAEIGK